MATYTEAAIAPKATTESSTRSRVALLAIVLGVTSILAIPAGLFWPEPSAGGETYAFSDIAGQRDLWWGLLTSISVGAIISVALQAVATMLLVRRRGSTLATIGGAGRAAFDVVNDDISHIFALMIPGAAMALVCQVLQSIALFRAKVVPSWVPWLSLAIVATFVSPGNGLAGLITAIPMAAAAVGLGYYAWRRVS
jgi:hypothetical protein